MFSHALGYTNMGPTLFLLFRTFSVVSCTKWSYGIENLSQILWIFYMYIFIYANTFDILSMYDGTQVPCACYETNQKLWNIRSIETTEDKVEIALVVKTFTSDSVFRLIPFCFVLVFRYFVHSSSYYQMVAVAYTQWYDSAGRRKMHFARLVHWIEVRTNVRARK